MTPQLPQVFVVPTSGVIVASAGQPVAATDLGLKTCVQDCEFAALMQDDVTDLERERPLLRASVPQTADLGTQVSIAATLVAVAAVVQAKQSPDGKEPTEALPEQQNDAFGQADMLAAAPPMNAAVMQITVRDDMETPKDLPIDQQSKIAARLGPALPVQHQYEGALNQWVDQVPPKQNNAPLNTIEQDNPRADFAEVTPAPPLLQSPAAMSVFNESISDVAAHTTATPAPPESSMTKVKPVTLPDAVASTMSLELSHTFAEAPATARFTPAETAFRVRIGEPDPRKWQSDSAFYNGGSVPDSAESVGVETTIPVTRHAPKPADNSAQPDEFAPIPDLPATTDDALILPSLFNVDVAQFAAAGADFAKLITPGAAQITVALPIAATIPDAFLPHLTTDLVDLAKTAPKGPVEILLNPEELGQLRFEIHQKSEQLRIVLSAERPEIVEFLRRNADQLLAEFKQAGFSGASLSFGQWDQHNSNSRPAPSPQPPPPDWVFEPPLQSRPAQPSLELVASTGLNIRL